jgi:AAA domain
MSKLDIKKVEECVNLTNMLLGKKETLIQELETVVSNVEKAKKWLAKQPDYLKFLQHLQVAIHQKNIGAFSELLTYFVKDVLKKDKDIIFELYTYHNLPALRIEALNDGQRENIYEGNGGSIANIVSTGLRLIALSRLPHRKFIVLDEPDCWLKPDHVPFFAKIIGEISEKLKIQTIIISHHDWNYFKDYGRVIRLESDGKNLEANIVHDTPVDVEDPDIIKKVRLRQFMSHQDTEFELHPYLTCLIGENDIGKSVLATALKSVAYNDSHDSYIKHFCDEAQVLIELNKNRQVLWQRFKTTNQDNPQKVKYSLFANNDLIASEFNSSTTPGFVAKELNISTTEDIDVHIGNQKQPVFLLSSDTKPQDKAKILSLGKESIILQKMMENIKNKTRQNKQIVKDGELKFNILNKQLENLGNIESLTLEAKKLKDNTIDTINQEGIIQKLQLDVLSLTNLETIGVIDEINYSKIIHQESPKDTEDLLNTIKNIYKEKHINELEHIQTYVSEVEILDTKEISTLIKRISLLKAASNLDMLEIESIESPKLKDERDFTSLSELIENLENQALLLDDLNTKKDNLTSWEVKINKEIEDFMKENNHICPTCHQQITKEHLIGDKHE